METIVKNRWEILTETKTSNLISELFGSILEKNDEDIFEWPFEYKETDKFGIIVTGKGGSTITTQLIDDHRLSSFSELTYEDINYFTQSNSNFKFGLDPSKKHHEELNSLVKILSGESEKDLIIVTRNPINKWLSGLVQQLDDEFKNSMLLNFLINKSYNIDADEIWDIVESTNITDETKYQILSELSVNYIKSALSERGTTQINHMQLYNEIFYQLLTNNNINLSKVKILDIDSKDGDIIKLFKHYYPDIIKIGDESHYWTQRPSYTTFFSNLPKLFRKNKEVYLITKKELNRDLEYYNILKKKYKNNFITNINI